MSRSGCLAIADRPREGVRPKRQKIENLGPKAKRGASMPNVGFQRVQALTHSRRGLNFLSPIAFELVTPFFQNVDWEEVEKRFELAKKVRLS